MDNDNRYIFDKRVMKKLLLKYGLILLTLLPILILVNWLCGFLVSTIGYVLLDVAIGLVYIFLVEVILDKIAKRKEAKEEEERKEAKKAKARKQKEENEADVIIVTEVEERKEKKNSKSSEDNK